MDFHQYSKTVVEDYLGTVVYVDDLIFSNNLEPKATNLGKIEPREIAARENLVKTESEATSEKQKRQLRPNIDPLTFINGFLKKGIHCTLLEVTNDDDSLESIKKILSKSDVAILDWQMHGDNGAKAIDLLLSLLSNAELRLIIIYTEEQNFASILPEIALPKLEKIGINNGNLDKSQCKYINGHTKIVVLKKGNGKNADCATSIEDLPDRIIEEFSEITEGLVSNTALKAVSVIRRNSHNLLGTFNKDLDAAYFNHRAFLETPANSELHMINWISDEIKDLLYFNKVSKEMDIENISLSLNSQDTIHEYPIFDKNGNLNKKISRDLMVKLLEKGCKEFNEENNKNKEEENNIPPKWFNNFYKSFDPKCSDINEKFAALSSLSSSSFTNDTHQVLTLGVIIKKENDILLCIQPSCDSVRLKKTTNFLFLKVEKQEGKFDLVIPDEDTYQKLSIFNKSDYIVLLQFSPKSGLVSSETNGDNEIFEDINNNKYKWMGNLKFPFAQRIVNSFVNEISRVGLDESEWLRRSSD